MRGLAGEGRLGPPLGLCVCCHGGGRVGCVHLSHTWGQGQGCWSRTRPRVITLGSVAAQEGGPRWAQGPHTLLQHLLLREMGCLGKHPQQSGQQGFG